MSKHTMPTTLVIKPTDEVTEIDGTPCRKWIGTAIDGSRCEVYVHRVAVDLDASSPSFQRSVEQSLCEQSLPLKSRDDVQRAHDLLHAVFLRDINLGQTDEIVEHAATVCLGLCWLLGCPCGELLQNNIQAIAVAAERAGVVITKAPRPMTRDEFDAWKKG